jgi:hypothetical protein
MKTAKGFLLLQLILLFFSCEKNDSNAEQVIANTLQEIINDRTLAHEGSPRGVPTYYDWAIQPRTGMGNNPGKFKAFVTWGQIYVAATAKPPSNTRVQIRNLKAYFLSKKSGKWEFLQGSVGAEGAAFKEDFSNNDNKPADVRAEENGTLSIRVGDGYNYHFWNPNRAEIDPTDIDGIFTTAQARLILHDPNGTDDRNKTAYLMSMGADYWSTLSAQWDNFKTNGDAGIGRFKYVEQSWKSFNMTTATPEQLRKNPPPF